MSNLHAIPVRKEVRGRRGSNHDIANRLLRDIGAAVEILAAEGKSSLIDLRHVPHMTAETYQLLREQLGTGEVTASVASDVEVTETAIAGVWWVTHRNPDGETVTEIVEITLVPSILRASRGEILAGIAMLAERLAALDAAASAMQPDGRTSAAREREP